MSRAGGYVEIGTVEKMINEEIEAIAQMIEETDGFHAEYTNSKEVSAFQYKLAATIRAKKLQ